MKKSLNMKKLRSVKQKMKKYTLVFVSMSMEKLLYDKNSIEKMSF